MAEQRGNPKALSTIITVGALLFTVGTGVYALSLSGTAKRVDALEVRQGSQDVTQGIVITKLDNVKEQMNRIEGLLTKHIDGGNK